MGVKSIEMTGRTQTLPWWPGGQEVKTTKTVQCTLAPLMAIANLHVDTDKIFKSVGFPDQREESRIEEQPKIYIEGTLGYLL